MKPSPFFQALPPYPGGKRKLCPWIFNQLDQVIPKAQWPQLTFIDGFSGGGAISLQAKLHGFGHLVANDLSDRSQLVLQGLIANAHAKLTLSSVYPLTQSGTPGFVSEQYAGSVFSERHALALDAALAAIHACPDPVRQAQLRLLLWKRVVRFVSFGTSIGTSNRPFAEALDGKRAYASLNPKRFQDGSLAHLLESCWKGLEQDMTDINRAVFPAQGKVSIYQEDILTLLPKLQGDVLYVDPPYAQTLGYSKSNEVLDAVLFGQLPQPHEESAFTHGVEAICEMLAGPGNPSLDTLVQRQGGGLRNLGSFGEGGGSCSFSADVCKKLCSFAPCGQTPKPRVTDYRGERISPC